MIAENDNQWVPVAVSDDIPDGTVVPARLPFGPIAVWRSAMGDIRANGDRCPHRGMRLSHGFVRGDTLSCIYHGWRFGSDGACQKIPAHPDVDPPKAINCGPLPVVECNGVVWAASKKLENEPNQYAGFEALRSVLVSASVDAILATSSSKQADGAIACEMAGERVLLLLNPYGADEVLVIVLVETRLGPTEKLAVSAGLEALRRSAETREMAA